MNKVSERASRREVESAASEREGKVLGLNSVTIRLGSGTVRAIPSKEARMSIAQIKPISYLKSHAAQIAQELADGADPLVVTQNGVARLVVMDAADYERREQTLALLKLLALGDREVERGQHLDADEVYTELAAE